VLKSGGKADKALTVSIVRVNEILTNKPLALANADALRGLRSEFFLAARQTLPQLAPTLRERWMAIADAATANPEFAPADQLAAQLMKITAAKAYAADSKIPTDVRSVALATSDKMLAVKQDAYVRAGVVNSAINIYIALDDYERARDLLALESTTSNTPYYYLGDLADVEEQLGHIDRSVELLAEAYAKAKGPASRFQWGYNYLDGLLRLKPDDLATIEKVGPGHRRARRTESHSPPHARASTSSTRSQRVEYPAARGKVATNLRASVVRAREKSNGGKGGNCISVAPPPPPPESLVSCGAGASWCVTLC
jgi:protein disulfide-isomerase